MDNFPNNFIAIIILGFVFNLILCFGVASAAKRKGRSFAAFFFISFFFSFIIAFIVVASIAPSDSSAPKRVMRMCPFCDEPVSPNAVICKHCDQQIEAVEVNSYGDVINKFLSHEEWRARFLSQSKTLPKLQDQSNVSEVSRVSEYLVWSQFLDEDGTYLLNGYYPPNFSEALQGWYICKSPWVRGSRFVVEKEG